MKIFKSKQGSGLILILKQQKLTTFYQDNFREYRSLRYV